VWVRTDKGKEFLNTQFQTLLKREGIEFQVCRNPDIKCASSKGAACVVIGVGVAVEVVCRGDVGRKAPSVLNPIVGDRQFPHCIALRQYRRKP